MMIAGCGGGVVGIGGGKACDASKSLGISCQNSFNDAQFAFNIVAHEIGHQLGANHTQNNDCNRNDATAVEPGSASTIMGYAGICAPNVQANSDPYFHGINLAEMNTHISGTGNCHTSRA